MIHGVPNVFFISLCHGVEWASYLGVCARMYGFLSLNKGIKHGRYLDAQWSVKQQVSKEF